MNRLIIAITLLLSGGGCTAPPEPQEPSKQDTPAETQSIRKIAPEDVLRAMEDYCANELYAVDDNGHPANPDTGDYRGKCRRIFVAGVQWTLDEDPVENPNNTK